MARAGVVEHLEGAAAGLDVVDRPVELIRSRQGSARVEWVWAGTPAGHRTSPPKADTGMAPAAMTTPDTVHRVATCTAMTQPSEKPMDTKPSGNPATPAVARPISDACPISSSAKALPPPGPAQ